VDAFYVLALLVDDGVDGHGGLTHLTVTDDQLALATADRHHRVDRFHTGLDRLVNGLTGDNAGSHFLNRRAVRGVDGALTVDGTTQCVYYAAFQFRANRHFQDAACAAGSLTFGEIFVIAQNHGTD